MVGIMRESKNTRGERLLMLSIVFSITLSLVGRALTWDVNYFGNGSLMAMLPNSGWGIKANWPAMNRMVNFFSIPVLLFTFKYIRNELNLAAKNTYSRKKAIGLLLFSIIAVVSLSILFDGRDQLLLKFGTSMSFELLLGWLFMTFLGAFFGAGVFCIEYIFKSIPVEGKK